MSNSEYKLKYPFTINTRDFHRYINRKCPCVYFFDNTDDLKSYYLVRRIKNTCDRYPKVLCYKIGWKSYINYPHGLGTSHTLDVAIWEGGIKDICINDPSVTQLDFIFKNVISRLSKIYPQIYSFIIEKDKKAYIRIKKERIKNLTKRKMSKFKIVSKDPHKICLIDESTKKIKEICEQHINIKNIVQNQNKSNEVLFSKLDNQPKFLNAEIQNVTFNFKGKCSHSQIFNKDQIHVLNNYSFDRNIKTNKILPNYNDEEKLNIGIIPKIINNSICIPPLSKYELKDADKTTQNIEYVHQELHQNIEKNISNLKSNKRKRTRPIKIQLIENEEIN